MELKKIEHMLTVCKVQEISIINTDSDFYFIGKTDEELSLVCKTEDTPQNTIERDDGWRGFRIQGVLDFSLIGILSKLSGILAEHKMGVGKQILIYVEQMEWRVFAHLLLKMVYVKDHLNRGKSNILNLIAEISHKRIIVSWVKKVIANKNVLI